MFFIRDCTKKPLVSTGRYFVRKYNFDTLCRIQEDIFNNYFEALEDMYHDNPYHNSTHAADVQSSTYFLISNSMLLREITDYEILATVIASLGHDVGHPGFNNRYMTSSQSHLAVIYNDISVLEMMHSALTFELMMVSKNNILKELGYEDLTRVRKLIIEMILATDMSQHFSILETFKAKHL